jgi:sugar lactone lactonase YvrE
VIVLTLLLGCPPPEEDTAAEECPRTSGTICSWFGEAGLAALGQEEVPATQSYLYLPQDVTVAPDGRLYVMDWNNHRIRRVNADGAVETVAGTGLLGDGPEGPALAASFNHPTNVTFDLDGTMLIAAWHNSRVERVDLDSGDLTYVAGNGQRSFGGDGESATTAVLDLPSSVAVDEEGILYVSDTANQRIRRVLLDGTIDTWGGDGTAGFAGDGDVVANAEFANPKGQAASPSGRIVFHEGSIFVADTLNQRVRKIEVATGLVSTIAGNGTPGFTGDGGPATAGSFFSPADLAFGPDGSLFVADTENSCVRRVDAAGILTTVAGRCGEPDFTGDGGPAVEARLYKPYGLDVDAEGNLYIADTYNHVVRVVWR